MLKRVLNKLKQQRSLFLFLLVFATYPLIATAQVHNDEPTNLDTQKPNILFILTDDQRHSAVGYANQEQVITPNLDAIAAQGINYTNAHIMGALNAAVCAPSRAMLMTGRGLFDISTSGENIAPEHVTMPQWFKQNGYHTFHTGKWHNGKAAFARSFSSGDKIFFGGMSDQYKVPLYDFDVSGEYSSKAVYFEVAHSTDIYADAAVRFIEKHEDDSPFFAFVAFQSPHDPKQVPSQYLAQYSPDTLADIPNLLPEHPFHNGELDVRDEWLTPLPRTQEDVKAHLAAYYAMITHIDERVGDMMQALKNSGKLDNTIVIFSSDNGIALGQHGLLGKQSLYDHSLRIPLLIKPLKPEFTEPKQVDDIVLLSQLFASLSDMAGIEPPSSVIHKSFINNDDIEPLNVFAYKSFQRAIKHNGYKLIEYSVKGKPHTQLFNLSNDPLETNNLALKAEHNNTLKFMQLLLQSGLSQVNDKANMSKLNWGIPSMEQWGERHRKPDRRAVYDKLKAMAEEEHAMVKGYFKKDTK